MKESSLLSLIIMRHNLFPLKVLWASCVILNLCMKAGVQAEYFSCLTHLEELLDTQSVLRWILKDIVEVQEKKVILLKSYAENYINHHEKAKKDFQSYIKNPINAFSIIKRLTTDFITLRSNIENDIVKALTVNLKIIQEIPILKFPSDADYKGAVQALLRLQTTYNLDTASIARGELNSIQSHNHLSGRDCLELGIEAFANNKMNLSKQWLEEALQYYEEGFDDIFLKLRILEYLEYLSYMDGNIIKALELTNELLKLDPTNERAIMNKIKYETSITKMPTELTITETKEENIVDKMEENSTTKEARYEEHCRFEKHVPAAIASKLKCRYADKGNAFLRLARVKEEELYFEPDIMIYHDILYNKEIDTFKRIAIPQLERAKVGNDNDPGSISNGRIAKLTWLKEEMHPYVATVNKRLETVTGLTFKTAEHFQILNYGIGGQFELHTDLIGMNNETYSDGNRIATIVIYLSDVAYGGATVFPNINVSVKPEKGAALFWYNLNHNGESYSDVLHAACPVFVGSKWILNKWIRERGQEFRRPCGLTYEN